MSYYFPLTNLVY